MSKPLIIAPESSAERVALWRALHVQADPAPHVFEDEIGLQLLAPKADWRERPDMILNAVARARASIVVRGRLVEDLLSEQIAGGVRQYVILGAGLDTFAQRRPELAARLTIFEVDQPGPQTWKRQRLNELGYGVPDWLRLVPVDFEAGANWWEHLVGAGFDPAQPALLVSAGVSMYLTREAIAATLRHAAALAPGSTLAMSYMLPLDAIPADERPERIGSARGASASGTPVISLFTAAQIIALAEECGFTDCRCVSSAELTHRYFEGRSDGLRPGSEEMLIARVT